jgi:hypothetical protein
MAQRGTQGFRLSRLRLDGFASFMTTFLLCVAEFNPSVAKMHKLTVDPFTTSSTTPVLVTVPPFSEPVNIGPPPQSAPGTYVPGKLHSLVFTVDAKVSEGGVGKLSLIANDDTTVIEDFEGITGTTYETLYSEVVTALEPNAPAHLYASVVGGTLTVANVVVYAEEVLCIPSLQRGTEWWAS